MLPPVPNAADFGITSDYGFLSPELPLEVLPDPYYADWEMIIGNLQPLILSKRLQSMVDHLPILSVTHLRTEAEWRRAYVVLVFILHGYVWGGDSPTERIPPQLTVPLFEICERLELPPVATYAGVCLWNYKPIFSDEPATNLDNLACLQTFTGSLDEQWFYLVSVAIEARGAPSIPLMLRAITAARTGNSHIVTECLQRLAETIDETNTLLQRMYENCDPYVFYNRIRPYLAGSKNMCDAGLPNGLLYDDGRNPEYRQYGGGSNAQSSLIQFFDIVLGVEHRPTGTSRNDKEQSTEDGIKSRNSFIHEMRTYMPGPHRRFLEQIDSVANIRPFVEARRGDSALCIAYDSCLAMLRVLRDKHITIVSRYIILQSRSARQPSQSTNLNPSLPAATNLATAAPTDKKKLRGTGGTALIPFLKQARDETGEPAIDAWARRLLSNGPADKNFASLSKVGEQPDGHLEVVGLCGTWTADENEGGICHW